MQPVRIAGVAALLGAIALTAVTALGAWLATPLTAAAAMTQAPTLSTPANGSTLTSFSPALTWQLPIATTQVQLQVAPFNNDGPGVNVIVDATASFTIPAPPDWYGLLPDMGYTWRVRATDATIAVIESDPSWGPWSAESTFRTPKVAIGTVAPYDPANGKSVTSHNPVLSWSSSTASIYYWEIQVSKDREFGANSFLYWVLVHGDVVFPNNAYTVPSSFPLEQGVTYSWRVRPRIQGDGTPLAWASAASFTTPATGSVILNVTAPANESTVSTPSVTVTGKTAAGAYVFVEDEFTIADSSGNFSATVTLTEGVNSLDIFATDASTGDTVSMTLLITYAP